MELPAGLLPNDFNIEIFANPQRFGKCFFMQFGQSKPFCELPSPVYSGLLKEVFLNKKAISGLKKMGVTENDYVEQYNYCNRGRLDSTPDISSNGKLTKEFVDCGRHGKNCPGEGLVCKLEINGVKITNRELECLKHNGEGKDYLQIKSDMGFSSVTAVNSLISRCKDKFNVNTKSELLIKSIEYGII